MTHPIAKPGLVILDELTALECLAVPPPWEVYSGHFIGTRRDGEDLYVGSTTAGDEGANTAAFIAELRNAAPFLIALAQRSVIARHDTECLLHGDVGAIDVPGAGTRVLLTQQQYDRLRSVCEAVLND